MVRVGEIGFESSEHLIARKTSGSGYKPNQRTNLVGCSTLSINNRVQRVGHAADHRDPDSVSDHPLFSELRSSAIEDSLAGIKA